MQNDLAGSTAFLQCDGTCLYKKLLFISPQIVDFDVLLLNSSEAQRLTTVGERGDNAATTVKANSM